MASDVLFKLELRLFAVGWQLWVSLMVVVVLFMVELMVGAVGWLMWVVSLVMGGVLFFVGVVG